MAGAAWRRLAGTGLEAVTFAWAGPLEPGRGHYYTVRGPSLLLEYDNTQNGANHIHSLARPQGRLGRGPPRQPLPGGPPVTFGAAADAPQLDRRAIAEVLVAAAGLATSITVLFLGMRAVMDIGGACASGGPYVPVQPCPEGVALLMPAGMLGLFGFGALGLHGGARLGGGWAGLVLLAWPALFISLGWNFLQYGLAPPPDLEPHGGPIWGWLIPGVIFVLIGGVPLWIAWRARDEIRGEGSPAVARRFGLPACAGPAGSSSPSPSMAWIRPIGPGRQARRRRTS